MKKLICYLLAFVMVLSCAPTSIFAEEAETEKASFFVDGTVANGVADNGETLSKAKVLIELGVLKSYTADADATKSTVSKTLNKITGLNVLSDKFFGENFKDSQLTVLQAASIMVNLAGHTSYLKAKLGDYTETNLFGYAKKIGILKGVSAKAGDNLLMCDFVNMVYNTLFSVEMMDIVGWTGVTEYQLREDVTAAYRYMGIVTVEGVVYGQGTLNLTTEGSLKDDAIKIENKVYTYKEFADPETIVGRYVKAYMDADSDNVVKALRIVEQKNEVLTLESDDIELADVKEREIPYYNKNDKKETAKLSTNVNVVFNGELVPFYDKEDLKVEDAYFTLIDNNDDDVYEAVIINKYTSVIVWRVSNGTNSYTVHGFDNAAYVLDDFFEDGYPFIDSDGKEAVWKEIGQYDVLSIRQTKTGVYNKVVHSFKKVNGLFKKSREDMKYVTIEDAEYKTTKEFKDNSLMLSKISVGDQLTAFVDAFGRIVGAIVDAPTEEYAAVMAMGGKSEFKGYKIKYLSQTGAVSTAEFNDTVLLNGSKVNASALVGGKSDLFFNTDGSIKQQLIKISKNGKGKVTSIKTADETKVGTGAVGCEGFTLNVDHSSTANEQMNVLSINGTAVAGSKYVIDSQTLVFGVNVDDDAWCSVGSGAGDKFRGKIYDIDEDYHVGAIVKNYGSKLENTQEWVNCDNDMYLVESTGLIQHPHKEGQVAYAAYVWKNGQKQTLICEDADLGPTQNRWNYMAYEAGDTYGDSTLKNEVLNTWMKLTWEDLEKGDVICANVKNGTVYSWIIQYKCGFDHYFEASQGLQQNQGGNYVGEWTYIIDTLNFYGQAVHAYGSVQQVNRFGFVLNNHYPSTTEGGIGAYPMATWNRSIPYGTNSRVYIVNSTGRQDITVGTFADIEAGDKVYTRHKKGSTDTVVVYR